VDDGDEVEVGFVPVQVERSAPETCAWQLATAEGHVLRVSGPIETDALRAVLAAITAQRRPR
jgi:hypothetical protein